jgi:hypothetical protein
MRRPKGMLLKTALEISDREMMDGFVNGAKEHQ